MEYDGSYNIPLLTYLRDSKVGRTHNILQALREVMYDSDDTQQPLLELDFWF